jgi:uncharacterized protein (DUF924 family)
VIGEGTPKQILDFWFSAPVRPLWFRSTAAFDAQLQREYGRHVAEANDGTLDAWKSTPSGCLALVLLLDQFPLNTFRNTARAFAGEAAARAVAEHALIQGFDRELNKDEKAFLYMPFMHSESIEDQHRSVALYTAAGLEGNLKFALHHRDIIRRFGRFPHRNAILDRQSTEEEQAYLSSPTAFKG